MSGLYQQIALEEPKLADRDEARDADERFSELVKRQSRFVFRVAYSVLRNAHDAEDVVQETFLKLYRTQGWKDMQEERAFLARVAWRLAVDRVPETLPDTRSAELEYGRTRATQEEDLIRLDQDAAVQRLIDALPQDLRLPLALSTVEGLRSHEIAAVMGIPDGSVRSRIARARKILKEKVSVLLESRRA